jgi:hypothetical protein
MRHFIVFLLVASGTLVLAESRDSTPRKSLTFDLFRINDGLRPHGGGPVCLSKGRFQDPDYNPNSVVMEQIIRAGRDAVPVLIDMLTDQKRKRGSENILCFWGEMSTGELAFTVLTDLFTDSTWCNTTVPGAEWSMLGPDSGETPSFVRLRNYIKKNGSKSLQEKWRRLWSEYKGKVYWDEKERCFMLKPEFRSGLKN